MPNPVPGASGYLNLSQKTDQEVGILLAPDPGPPRRVGGPGVQRLSQKRCWGLQAPGKAEVAFCMGRGQCVRTGWAFGGRDGRCSRQGAQPEPKRRLRVGWGWVSLSQRNGGPGADIWRPPSWFSLASRNRDTSQVASLEAGRSRKAPWVVFGAPGREGQWAVLRHWPVLR